MKNHDLYELSPPATVAHQPERSGDESPSDKQAQLRQQGTGDQAIRTIVDKALANSQAPQGVADEWEMVDRLALRLSWSDNP